MEDSDREKNLARSLAWLGGKQWGVCVLPGGKGTMKSESVSEGVGKLKKAMCVLW